MTTIKANIILATGMALALAACGEKEAAAPDPVLTEDVAVSPQEFDPASRQFALSADAQKRRDGFDQAAFMTEYGGYRVDVDSSADAEGTEAESSLADRGSMNWSFLDRNEDGQLSVAEYAIWAVPLDPEAPKATDETRPYVTAEQASKAADSFFYYDLDGDTYLSQREFTSARRGEDFG